MPPPVFPWNDVWETSAEIPYWWSITALLIGWSNFQPIRSTTQIWVMTQQISMEFLHLFLRCHFAGEPVKASQNVGCFLRPFWNVWKGGCDLLLPQSDYYIIEKASFHWLSFSWVWLLWRKSGRKKKHGNINFGQCWSLPIMYAKLFLNMITGNPCYLIFSWGDGRGQLYTN